MSDQDGNQRPSLSPAEWQVMKVIWQHGELAARDVFSSLPADCDWAYPTVKTLLSRLVTKGVLDFTAVGNSYLYRPLFAKEDLAVEEARLFAARILDSQTAAPALNYFIRNSDLDRETIESLRRLLDERAADQPGRTQPGGAK